MLKLSSTILSRAIVLLLSFAIIVLNSNYLGASAVGTISLIVLSITIMVITNELVGGSALVYLSVRHNNALLFVIAYCWAVINALVFIFIIRVFHLVPSIYYNHTIFIGFTFSLISINNNLLLGRQKIVWFNFLNIMQFVIIACITYYFYTFQHKNSIFSYLMALKIGYLCIWILSTIKVTTFFKPILITELKAILKQVFKLGFWVQLSNLTQIINYRFNYYTLEHNAGSSELGRFSIATQLSEAAWVVGKSNALVSYSDVSNANEGQIEDTVLNNSKIVGIATMLIMLIVNLIPSPLFKFIFGPEFINMKNVILILTPGIIALSVTMNFSSYFSGIGKIYINAMGSLGCLAITIPLSLFLVPKYGIVGAALVCSVSYIALTIYSIFQFLRITKLPFKKLLITAIDLKTAYFKAKVIVKKA